ncbi:MAG: nucleotidyltransferase domain-containing protein [Candidatus Pacearchaeota archaeon]|jgi:predicted nucleotidyltransferase/uncharacterized protein (UPF0332 family)
MASKKGKKSKKVNVEEKTKKNFPTLDLRSDREIAMDFAVKVYRKFDKLVKAIVLFGSSAKNTAVSGSDIDLVIVVDDASINWDPELITWYREELGKIVEVNPYRKELHVNTIKTTTFWSDLLKGDPIILNVLRYGEALIDAAGFFNPIKALLIQGRIKPTPESIYTALQRAPEHLMRSKIAKLSSIEGVYWSILDSAQAALMSVKQTPASPEHIPQMLKEIFVDAGELKMDYVLMVRDIYLVHKRIFHGEMNNISGKEIDDWQVKAEDFINTMVAIVRKNIS